MINVEAICLMQSYYEFKYETNFVIPLLNWSLTMYGQFSPMKACNTHVSFISVLFSYFDTDIDDLPRMEIVGENDNIKSIKAFKTK